VLSYDTADKGDDSGVRTGYLILSPPSALLRRVDSLRDLRFLVLNPPEADLRFLVKESAPKAPSAVAEIFIKLLHQKKGLPPRHRNCDDTG